MIILLLLIFILILSDKNIFKYDPSILSCGLLGYIGSSRVNPLAIKALFIDNQSRGSHSTGMAYMDNYKSNKIKTLKSTSKASLFIKNKDVQSKLHPVLLIGHTRYATMGEHTAENSHPFHYGDIVGAHNGWLLNKKDVCKDNEKYSYESFLKRFGYKESDFPVDSMAIYYHMNKTNDITAMKDIEGTMALSFIKDRKLHLYRRESKPLFIKKGKNFVMYSSLESSFEYIYGENHGAEMLEPNKIFVFNKGELEDIINVPEPKVEIKLDTLPSEFYQQEAWSDWDYTKKEDKSKATTTNNNSYNINYSKHGAEMPDNIKDIAWNKPLDGIPFNHHSMINVFNNEINKSKYLMCLGYKSSELVAEAIFKNKKTNNDQSILLINISNNDKNKSPLVNWRATFDDGDEVGVTSINGRLGLNVPKEIIRKGKGKVLIHPPNGEFIKTKSGTIEYAKSYYTLNIFNIKIGQVLEVACTVPFFRDKKKKGKQSIYLPLPKAYNIETEGYTDIFNKKTEDKHSGDDETRNGGKQSQIFECEKGGGDYALTVYKRPTVLNTEDSQFKFPHPEEIDQVSINSLNTFKNDVSNLYHTLNTVMLKGTPILETIEGVREIEKFLMKYDNQFPTAYFCLDLVTLKECYLESIKNMTLQNKDKVLSMIERNSINDKFNDNRLDYINGVHRELENNIVLIEETIESASMNLLKVSYEGNID